MLIIATSPTVMLFTTTVIFEGTLDTLKPVVLCAVKYLSSPRYLIVTPYFPLSRPESGNWPIPFVMLTA